MIWLLLLIPVAWSMVSKIIFGHHITMKEMIIQMVASVILTLALYMAASMYDTSDRKVVHGHVTEKHSVHVPCEHSYQCNCRRRCSGSGENRSCHRVCDTCYEHSYDIDWIVKSTVGQSTINRVDSRGVTEPPRFTAAFQGEPYATTKTFKNWVAASNQSLFHRHSNEKSLKYPKVYDYYKFDQVIVDGAVNINLADWNKDFAKLSSVSKNGSNVFMILTDKSDINEYSEYVKGSWKTGKINDVIIVTQIKENKIVAVRAFSYANDKNNELLVIKLRDELLNLPLDSLVVSDVVFKLTNEFFKETPSEEFEYLRDSIQFSTASMIFLTIMMLVVNIGLTIVMIKTDVDNY